MIRIAVFAAEPVGLQVVEHFSEQGVPIQALALLDGDPDGLNERIQNAAGCERVYMDTDLYNPRTLKDLKALDLDLVFLGWWPRIIKKPLFDISRLGFMNMHPSLLPFNRGKHYYFWNLVEGNPFGVTLHLIDEDIDSGEISFQLELETSWEDDGNSLRERAMAAIVDLFKDSFPRIIEGDIPRVKPDLSKGTYHWGKELREASRIDLKERVVAADLINRIRGRSGFPAGGAWFEGEDGEPYEITVNIRRKDKD